MAKLKSISRTPPARQRARRLPRVAQRKLLERQLLEFSEHAQRRIARELHDGPCQEIAGIAFHLRALQQQARDSRSIHPDDLSPILELLQKAVRHARTLCHSLYPVDPNPNGLRVALDQLAAATAELPGLACSFHCPRPLDVHDREIATQLYRIAQEALRDALAHAHATDIRIALTATPRALRLTITDNRNHAHANGHALPDMTPQLMHHRAAVIGARLHVAPGKHGGLAVTCELPAPLPPLS
ncbi:MAG TPA: histidine kinase [Phycisphaerae bacterium]|nr:histidine kinase [Phycisphaerae bacterium]